MTWWSLILGSVATVFILVGFFMLGRASVQMFRHVRLGAADPFRAGPVVPRLGTLLREFLGHTRMLKWGWQGAAHWFVMVGFGALVLTLVQAVGQTFDPAFEIPWLGHQAWYGLFVELIALTTVLGIGYLIVLRQLTSPRRSGPEIAVHRVERGSGVFRRGGDPVDRDLHRPDPGFRVVDRVVAVPGRGRRRSPRGWGRGCRRGCGRSR